VRADEVAAPEAAGATDLLELADALRPLAEQVRDDDGRPALEQLVRIAVGRVPGATSASLVVRRGPRFTTEASTDDAAAQADRLQFHLGSGPCVDGASEGSVCVTGDVATDERWPRWGPAVCAGLGVLSVLSQRLTLLDDSDAVAALNIYSGAPHAFGPKAVAMGLVLSSHGSLVVTAMLARDRASNLVRALESNREVGVAMGILMQRHSISREAAFDVLRRASQDSNRKLAAVASDVADTGILAVGDPALPVPDARPRC